MKSVFAAGVRAALLSVTLALGACASQDKVVPQVPLPPGYLQPVIGVPPQAADITAKPLEASLPNWWTLFGSEELDALVDRALANSQDLKAAAARIAQARAQLRGSEAEEMPELSARGSAEANWPRDGIGSVPPGGDIDSERLYQLALRLTWEPDLWGRKRAAAEASFNRLLSSAYTRDTVRRDLVAGVVRAYLDVLAFSDRARVARQSNWVLSEMLKAVEGRLENGEATALDLAQQQAAVHSTAAAIPLLELQRARAFNRLAVLMGEVPANLKLQRDSLDGMRYPLIRPGVPSWLLTNRADIRAAEADILAAAGDVAEARARLLPNIELSGETGYGALYFDRLFRPESMIASLVGSITQPIFDFGRRNARIRTSEARQRELVAVYVRTVHRAVQQVEDSLAGQRYFNQRQELLSKALQASQTAYDLARESYGFGATDYLTLLDTQRTLFNAQDAVHEANGQRFQAVADLLQALGGAERLPPKPKPAAPEGEEHEEEEEPALPEQAPPAEPAPGGPEQLLGVDAGMGKYPAP